MNATNDFAGLVDNLAGHWTEPVLKILRTAGVPISVDTEVETWRTLKKALRAAIKEPTRTDFVPRLRVPAEPASTGAYAVV